MGCEEVAWVKNVLGILVSCRYHDCLLSTLSFSFILPTSGRFLLGSFSMRLAYIQSASIFLGIASSLVLDSQWNLDDGVPTPTQPSKSSWFSLPTNTSDVFGPTASMTCDGDKFGYELSARSCDLAVNGIPTSDIVVLFGERHTGAFDVDLPFIFMSRT